MALSLAVPGDILEIVLEYLYTDQSQVVDSKFNYLKDFTAFCNFTYSDNVLEGKIK